MHHPLVLVQFYKKKAPGCIFLKTLSTPNKHKSVYNSEALALVFALQKWKHYLLGRKFVTLTDHNSLFFFKSVHLHLWAVETIDEAPAFWFPNQV